MLAPRCGQRLAHEPFPDLLSEAVATPVRGDGFQRDGAPQLRIEGPVHLAHPALTDVLADLVAVDALSLHEQGVRPRMPKITFTRHRTAAFYPQNETMTSHRGHRFRRPACLVACGVGVAGRFWDPNPRGRDTNGG